VDTREMDTGERQVTVAGEIDIATAPQLDKALAETHGQVVLDLRNVPFMDSSGIRVLLVHKARLDGDGGHLRLLIGSEEITRLLELTGLTETFDIESHGA
jgi:anti-anti-sigma factor